MGQWSRPGLVGGIAGSIFVTATVVVSSLGLMSRAAATLPGEASTALSVVETASGTTCDTYDGSATCAAVNDYSSRPIARGQSGTIVLTFKNTGEIDAASSLLSVGELVGAHRSRPRTPRGNSPLHLSVLASSTSGQRTLYSGPIDRFTHPIPLGGLDAGAWERFTFILSNPLTSSADAPRLSQSMQWQFVR